MSRSRGIALIMTLMVASLLTLLSAAFIAVNRSNVSLIQGSENQLKALEAAQTGEEYARMLMEGNNHWGDCTAGTDPAMNVANLSQLKVTESLTTQSGQTYLHQVVGVIKGGDSHFQIAFLNPNQATTMGGNGLCVSDIANGWFDDASIDKNPGNSGAWLPATLPKGDISVNYLLAPSWVNPLQSPNDAVGRSIPRGQVKLIIRGWAQGSVRRVDCSFAVSRFTESGLTTQGAMAVLVNAGGTWTIGSKSSRNQISSNGTLALGGANANTPSVTFQGSGNNNGTLKTSSSDVYIAPPTGGYQAYYTPATDSVSINYPMTPPDTAAQLAAASSYAKGTIENNAASNPVPLINAAQIAALTQTSSSVNLPGGTYTFTKPDKVTYTAPGGGSPSNFSPPAGVKIDQGKFVVNGQTYLNFSDSTNITSAPGSGVNPALAIGYLDGNTLDYKGAVVNVQGDLSVRGAVQGQGSLVVVANQNGTGKLQIQGKSAMSADPDKGVAAYADGSIVIAQPSPAADSHPDFDVMQAALANVPSQEYQTNGNHFGNWGNLDSGNQLNRVGSSTDNTPLTAADGSQVGHGSGKSYSNQGTLRSTDVNTTFAASSEQTAFLAQFPLIQANTVDGAVGSPPIPGGPLDTYMQLFSQWTGASATPVTVNGVSVPAPTDLGVSLGRYERLKEFLQSNENALAAGGNPASLSPDSVTWANVTSTVKDSAVNSTIVGSLNYYYSQLGSATQYQTLQQFFGNGYSLNTNPFDAAVMGLMYSNKDIFVGLQGGSFNLTGALVARGNTAISDVRSATTIYDSTLMDKLQTMLNGGFTKLTVSFWSCN